MKKLVVFDYHGTLEKEGINQIQYYKKRGFKIGVLSNAMKSPSLQRRVKNAGADFTIASNDKIPHLKKIGKGHTVRIYVGDRKIDQKRAIESGFEYRKPEII